MKVVTLLLQVIEAIPDGVVVPQSDVVIPAAAAPDSASGTLKAFAMYATGTPGSKAAALIAADVSKRLGPDCRSTGPAVYAVSCARTAELTTLVLPSTTIDIAVIARCTGASRSATQS